MIFDSINISVSGWLGGAWHSWGRRATLGTTRSRKRPDAGIFLISGHGIGRSWSM